MYALYKIPEWYYLDSPIHQTPFQRYFEVATQVELTPESIYNPQTGEGVYLPIGAFLEGINRKDEEFLQWLLPRLSKEEREYINFETTSKNLDLSGQGNILPPELEHTNLTERTKENLEYGK